MAQRRRNVLEWKLESDERYLRNAIIHRARSLAERLRRVADGLEQDPDYGINTIGELQGNGVELDTWCARLGLARDTLKLVRQALAEAEKEAC
jgi:hypothetical protein